MQFSYLARQGKVFRGDDESATASNKGNFFELVKMFSITEMEDAKIYSILQIYYRQNH